MEKRKLNKKHRQAHQQKRCKSLGYEVATLLKTSKLICRKTIY